MAPAYNTIHIILDQLNEVFVERAFRRIASSIIWTVSAIAIASGAKALAAMRQRRRHARNCSCRRPGARDRSA
jgi:hypothetical protein